MRSSRRLPVVGAPAQVRRLGHIDDVVIVATDGPTVTVQTADGEDLTFELHRGKGQFYLAGAGSTGPRLILATPGAPPGAPAP